MPDVNLRLEELNKPSVDAGLLELRAVFDRFDKDSSGHIDRYELRLVLEELGKDPSDKDIEKMLADGDRDGNNLIDWQEFAGMMGHKVDAPMSSEDEDAAVLAEVRVTAAQRAANTHVAAGRAPALGRARPCPLRPREASAAEQGAGCSRTRARALSCTH